MVLSFCRAFGITLPQWPVCQTIQIPNSISCAEIHIIINSWIVAKNVPITYSRNDNIHSYIYLSYLHPAVRRLSSSLSSSDGCWMNSELSKSRNKWMVNFPLLCDKATYALNGLSLPDGVFPISMIAYSIVWP